MSDTTLSGEIFHPTNDTIRYAHVKDWEKIRSEAESDLEGFWAKEAAELHWTHPAGGIYVWLTLPEHVDTSRGGKLFDACVKYGVLYVPGSYSFHPDGGGRVPRHHMRLCYGQVPLEEIEDGIARLAEAVMQEIG